MMNGKLKQSFFRSVWMAILAFFIIGGASASFYEVGQVMFLPFVARQLPAPTSEVYAHPLISEVLYDPVGDEPWGEWIEIYNPGTATFDLSRFKIGDAELPGDHEGMLRFPAGSTLSPQEVIVIANKASAFEVAFGFKPDYEMLESDAATPNMIKYYAWAGYNLELTDSGDEVLLVDGEDQIVDMLSWGSSTFAFDPSIPNVPVGSSLERKPADIDRDQAGDWKSQANPAPKQVDLAAPTHTPTSTFTPTATFTSTPTETPLPCGQAPLLISEVLYDPAGDLDPAGEWIEIYNPSAVIVNLACVRIGDEETMGGGEGMLVFPAGRTLLPGAIIVIANQASSFVAQYSFRPDYEIADTDPFVPDLLKDPQWATGSLNLSNAGDEVLILDGDAELIDSVSWADSTFAFEPAVPGVAQGHSIERKPAFQDTNSADDWIEQSNPQPANVDLSGPTATPTATATRTSTATPTPTRTPIPCQPLALVVSEVLYDPLGTDTGQEWLEIFNPGIVSVNLACAKVGDEETRGGGEAMLVFPDGQAINPGEAVVIANRAADFSAAYSFNPDFEIIETDPTVPNMLRDNAWGTGSFNLSNTGDDILILDWLDRPVDAVSWGASTFAFDPAAPLVAEGHSLARVPADRDTDTAKDWLDQSDPLPGSVELAMPTPVPSSTPSRTPSPTATRTQTPTRTTTPTLMPTQTTTPTKTFTPGPTFTNTPTGTASPTQSLTPSPTCAPTGTYTPSPTPTQRVALLISEVFYAPEDPEATYQQWVEIYNPGSISIDLSNYKLGDEENRGGTEAMMQFPIGSWIDPGQVVVVASNAKYFHDNFRFLPEYEFTDSLLEVPDLLPYVSWSGGSFVLRAESDEVLLLDHNDIVADVVAFGGSVYPDFQPAVPGVELGHSIERRPADQDTDSNVDWINQANPNPGWVSLSSDPN